MATATATATAKLIEKETVTRDYDFLGCNAIIEYQGKRHLICDGYAGQESPCGGAVRWRHGVACAILPDDTIASLRQTSYNHDMSVFEALLMGCAVDGRHLLDDWDGHAVAAIAKQVGL